MVLSQLSLYLDYKQDESYTPCKICVLCGTSYHDLQELREYEIEEPCGWVHIPLTVEEGQFVRAYLVQIEILANHQNGKDCHIRQVQIFTPRTTSDFSNTHWPSEKPIDATLR